jgi:glucose 1-dehydrogenase
MSCHGKVAVVTGAGRGIGRAIALALARAGASVVVNDLAEGPDAARVAAEITALGGGVRGLAVAADVADRAAMERLFERCLAEFGRVDVAVANAGFTIRRPVLEYTEAEIRRVIDVVQLGTFHTFQLAARCMVARAAGGRLLAIGSIQGERPFAGTAPYGMSKAAVSHLVTTFARELAAHRITVNAINPGWIDTPGERALATEEDIAREASRLPWGRLGSPDEIAAAAAFLAGPGAEYVTGSTLRVDGGMTLVR